jgi:hypothetical protein
MTFIVVNNKAIDPINVCLLGAKTVMLAPGDVTNLIEQFWFVCLLEGGYTCWHEHDCVLPTEKDKPD